MSRIGKTPIEVPKAVTVDVTADAVTVKGPKGERTLQWARSSSRLFWKCGAASDGCASPR